jgi:hypothetical protein
MLRERVGTLNNSARLLHRELHFVTSSALWSDGVALFWKGQTDLPREAWMKGTLVDRVVHSEFQTCIRVKCKTLDSSPEPGA